MQKVSLYSYSAKCISHNWPVGDLTPHFCILANFHKDKAKLILILDPYKQCLYDLQGEVVAADLKESTIKSIQPFGHSSHKEFYVDSYYSKVELSSLEDGTYLNKFQSLKFVDAFYEMMISAEYNYQIRFDPEASTDNLKIFLLADTELKNPLFTYTVPTYINRFGYRPSEDYDKEKIFWSLLSASELEYFKKTNNELLSQARWIVDGDRLSRYDIPEISSGNLISTANIGRYHNIRRSNTYDENIAEHKSFRQCKEHIDKENEKRKMYMLAQAIETKKYL